MDKETISRLDRLDRLDRTVNALRRLLLKNCLILEEIANQPFLETQTALYLKELVEEQRKSIESLNELKSKREFY